jgi:hypothetical protein
MVNKSFLPADGRADLMPMWKAETGFPHDAGQSGCGAIRR